MSTVAIKIDGVDITDDVLLANAVFRSSVNGAIGLADLRVKDVGHAYEFFSGGSLTLDVDGIRVWGGYVMRAIKSYPFSALDTTVPTTVPRYWTITGTDYNILFSTRVVFKASDPTGKLAFSYDADTYDDTIINDIFDNYLDLSGLGLTRGGVTRISKAILDVPGKIHSGAVASAGMTWQQMMHSVQRATGGVFYISPTKVLTYVDVEAATSDYSLTDQPTGAFDVGYQSFGLIEDGTKLINDMLLWGAGNGSPNYVFSRTSDSASIAAHGRWQQSLVTSGIFRQASADIVADSYVYGTPQSHRGGKDDGVTFEARVFQPVFQAGDVVDTISAVFGYSDALPVRKMTIQFVNPETPIFDLVLSHEIDQAVSLFEFMGIRFNFEFPDIGIGAILIPGLPAARCDCGITDAFGRIEATDFGQSDSLIQWIQMNGSSPGSTPGISYSVDGIGGIITVTDDSIEDGSIDLLIPTAVFTFRVIISDYSTTSRAFIDLTSPGGDSFEYITLRPAGSEVLLVGQIDGDGVPFTFDGRPFYIKASRGLNDLALKVWYVGDTEPAVQATVYPGAQTAIPAFCFEGDAGNNGDSWKISDLRVTDDMTGFEIDRCLYPQFDDFHRTLSGTVGTSEDGHTYTQTIVSPDVTYGVDGDFMFASANTTMGSQIQFDITGTPSQWAQSYFLLETRFRTQEVGLGVQVEFRGNELFEVGQNRLRIIISNAIGQGRIGLDCFGDGTSASIPKTDWAAGVWYRVAWEYDIANARMRARVWQEDFNQTAWIVTLNSSTAPHCLVRMGTGWVFNMNLGVAKAVGGVPGFMADYIDFGYDGRLCSPGVPPSPEVPPTGEVCETLVHSGGTDFACRRAFFSGSLQVWVNGVQQTAFTFTALLGEFSLTTAIDANDELRVCYRANGDPI